MGSSDLSILEVAMEHDRNGDWQKAINAYRVVLESPLLAEHHRYAHECIQQLEKKIKRAGNSPPLQPQSPTRTAGCIWEVVAISIAVLAGERLPLVWQIECKE